MATLLNPLVLGALEAAIGDNLGFIHGLIGLSLNTHMRNGDISPDIVAEYLRNLRKKYKKSFGERDIKVLMIDDFTYLLFGENFSRLASKRSQMRNAVRAKKRRAHFGPAHR